MKATAHTAKDLWLAQKRQRFMLGELNHFNGRHVGCRVSVHFDGIDWIDGTVVKLLEGALLVEFKEGKTCWTEEIDPDAVYGVLLYCPIRIGSDYQAEI